MTAETAGKAVGSVWATLCRLRDQWLLVVFMTGALFWLRDTYERFAGLPSALTEQGARVVALQKAVADLESALERETAARGGAVMRFPGNRHGVGDARAGEWTVARLVPTRPLRRDCRTVRVDAWMIDAGGRWFSTETGVGSVPKLEHDTDLAFGVRVPDQAAPGRAQVLVQLTHDCGTHLQVQTAPRLPFRVIPD